MFRVPLSVALLLSLCAAFAFAGLVMPPVARSNEEAAVVERCEAYQRLHFLLASTERGEAFSINQCIAAMKQ